MSKSLQSALGVWSDAMAIRHMAVKQHLWISRVLALGVTLLAGHKEWEVRRTGEWEELVGVVILLAGHRVRGLEWMRSNCRVRQGGRRVGVAQEERVGWVSSRTERKGLNG